MKKRWDLIQSGSRREHITRSIRGGSLFENKIKKGSVKRGSVVSGENVDCVSSDNVSDIVNVTPVVVTGLRLSHLNLMSSRHLKTILIIALRLKLISLRDFTCIVSNFLMHVV